MLKVSQIFGPTVQGEGSAAGRHCLFLRLFDCNLHCAWCDTAYTWAYTDARAARTRSGKKYDKFEPHLGSKLLDTGQVLDALSRLWPIRTEPTMIVVSGGEPMMQQEGLLPVLERLDSYTIQIHVETAGTIMPIFPIGIRLIRQFNCSPKLATSGNRDTIRYKPAVLAKLNEDYDTWFKFVVTDDWREDFQEIDKIVREVGIPHSRVQVMPEGTAAEETIDLAQTIVSAALERGYGLSMRTHVLLWGDEPGK